MQKGEQSQLDTKERRQWDFSQTLLNSQNNYHFKKGYLSLKNKLLCSFTAIQRLQDQERDSFNFPHGLTCDPSTQIFSPSKKKKKGFIRLKKCLAPTPADSWQKDKTLCCLTSEIWPPHFQIEFPKSFIFIFLAPKPVPAKWQAFKTEEMSE